MGLLDQLFGSGGDDPRSQAMGLLGAGLMAGNPAAAFAQANGLFAQAPQRRLEQEYKQMQMENIRSEMDARKLAGIKDARQQAMMESMFPGLLGTSSGAVPPTGAPAIGGAPQAPGGGSLMDKVRALGLPEEVIKADLMFNGGKKIAELINERSKPNWQNINGNLVNSNAPGFQGGLQAGVSAGSGGQVTAWQPDGQGGLVVGAPRGALDTFNAYQRKEQGAKADFDPMVIPPRAGQQNPTQTTRGAFVNSLQPSAPAAPASGPLGNLSQESSLRGAVAGPMGADPEAIKRELQKTVADLTSGKPIDANSRKMLEAHIVDLSTQLKSIGGAAPAQTAQPAVPGGIALQSSAEKIAADEQAKANVKPLEQRQGALASAQYLDKVLTMALNHPGRETATGLSGTLDPRNYVPGTDAKNFAVVRKQIEGSAFLQAFETLKGGGQITEREGEKATDAIIRINTAQSDAEFKKALEEFQGVVRASIARQKSNMPNNAGGATGGWDSLGNQSSMSPGGWSAVLKK